VLTQTALTRTVLARRNRSHRDPSAAPATPAAGSGPAAGSVPADPAAGRAPAA